MRQWKPNLATLLVTVDLHTHTHTAESTRFLALENQLKNMLQEFGTVCPLFQQGNLPVLLNALKWFRMTCTCRHRLNVSPTFGSWSCRRSASTSWSVWSNRQTAPSDAVWSRVVLIFAFAGRVFLCLVLVFLYIYMIYCDVEQHVSYAQDEWTSRRQWSRPQRQRCRHMQKLYIWHYMKLCVDSAIRIPISSSDIAEASSWTWSSLDDIGKYSPLRLGMWQVVPIVMFPDAYILARCFKSRNLPWRFGSSKVTSTPGPHAGFRWSHSAGFGCAMVCPGAQAVCKLRPSSATPRLSCCVGDLPNLKPAMDLMDSRLGISMFETGILCDWKERCPCILQRKFLLVSRAEVSWKGRMSLVTLILQTHRAFWKTISSISACVSYCFYTDSYWVLGRLGNSDDAEELQRDALPTNRWSRATHRRMLLPSQGWWIRFSVDPSGSQCIISKRKSVQRASTSPQRAPCMSCCVFNLSCATLHDHDLLETIQTSSPAIPVYHSHIKYINYMTVCLLLPVQADWVPPSWGSEANALRNWCLVVAVFVGRICKRWMLPWRQTKMSTNT